MSDEGSDHSLKQFVSTFTPRPLWLTWATMCTYRVQTSNFFKTGTISIILSAFDNWNLNKVWPRWSRDGWLGKTFLQKGNFIFTLTIQCRNSVSIINASFHRHSKCMVAFCNRKIRLRSKNAINLCTLFSGVLQYKYILGEGINIKSNAYNSEILLKEERNVRLFNKETPK